MPLTHFVLARMETNTRLPRALVHSGVRAACRNEARGVSITAVFVNDVHIAKLHADFLADDSPTDVLTFVTAESPRLLEAEIYVSVDTARRQAAEAGVSATNEFVRLAVHGALHAVGYDDRTPGKKKVMWAKQEEIVARTMRSRSRGRR